MLRMIIVDDERMIRETISAIIDWEALGIQVIGLCKNGLEAYDMILDEYPDIVLTDINMPGLSGLDLIQRITQAARETEFVILSGYGDYTYTREAMRLGIQYYLLKPCSEEDIIEVMQQVKKRCMSRRLRKQEIAENYMILRRLQESVVRNLIVESMSENPNYDGLRAKYEQFLDFKNVGYEVCRLDHVTDALWTKYTQAFQACHNQRAEKIPAYFLQVGDVLYLGFESYDYDYTELDAQMAAVCQPPSVYSRRSVRCLEELLPLLYNAMHGRRCVKVGLERHCLRQSDESEPVLLRPEDDFVAKIIEIVRTNISDPELSLKMISEKHLYMNVDYVSRKFVKATGKKFSAFLAETRIETAKKLFAAEPGISVNTVAGEVGCGNNPQYFSQLFKKMAGMTPTEYLRTLGG